MLKDPFGKGMIAGIIGVVAINIAELLLRLLKISETALWEAGGIVFLSESALATPIRNSNRCFFPYICRSSCWNSHCILYLF